MLRRRRSALALAAMGAIGLAGCAPDNSRIARAEAQLPLFSPDKEKGLSALVAAVKDLKTPPQQKKDCDDFIADLLANRNIKVFEPSAAGPSIDSIAAQEKLDRCPATIFRAPELPAMFQNLMPTEPASGTVYERYETYDEQASATKFVLLTYRSMAQVQLADGEIGLHSIKSYAVTIDPASCRSSLAIEDQSTPRQSNVGEDTGMFLVSWKDFPVVVNALHQTTKMGPAVTGELWSIGAQSQFPKAMPLMCMVSWRR